MAIVENKFVCDLSKPVQAQVLKGNVFSLDNLGSRISVLIKDNGTPATISGTMSGNCILPDGSTVNISGGLTTENGGSKAYVDIPQSCLLIPGVLKIAVKCTSSSVITTLAAIVANVYMTKTDNVITPSQQIITDWNAEISASLANQDAEIDSLKSAIKYIGELKSGYIKYTNGEVTSPSGSRKHAEFPVCPGIIVTYYYTYGAEYNFGLCFYDANGLFISGTGHIVTDSTQYFVVPDGAYICKATVASLDDVTVTGYNDAMQDLRIAANKIPEIENAIGISAELKSGYIRYTDGSVLGTSGSRHYAEFPVTENESVVYRFTEGAEYNFGLAFYDIEGNFISGSGHIVTSSTQIFVVPTGAYTCKATVSSLSDVSVCGYNNPIASLARDASKAVLFDYSQFTLYENYYANYVTGKLTELTGASAVEFPVVAGMKFDYLFTVESLSGYGLFFVDEYGNTISKTQAQTTTQTITVPSGAVKCYATIITKSQIVFSAVANALVGKKSNVYTPGLIVSTNPLETIDDTTGMLDLFLHVGCIGDSLASGESYWNDGGTVQGADFYQYSWGQFLARKTGNTYYNWSKGGLTTKTWLQSTYATECFDGNHKCEAYIIGLGQNDKNVSMTIGTSADINLSDYTQNADTFYGNYGKIIQKIQEIQPQAKIFVLTDMNPYVNRDGYNTAISAMPTIFDNVYLLDLYTYGSKYYNNSIVSAQMRGSHYNAYGYKLFAMMIANYINWYVTTNYSEFEQVELIGTGHSWTDSE